MKKYISLGLLYVISFSVFSQTEVVPSSDLWYSTNNTVIGNSGNLIEPYAGYNSQNNKTIQLHGNSLNYGIPNLSFVKSCHQHKYGGSLVWISDNFSSTDKRFAQISGNLTSGYGSISFHTRGESDPNSYFNNMIFDQNGNLGIGIDNPSASIEINKSDAELKIFSDLSHQPALTLGVNQNDRWSLGVYEANNSTSSRAFFIYENHTGVSGTSGVRFAIAPNGNVGIGTRTPQSKLAVEGQIRATEVKVMLDIGEGPDYVFEPTYELRTLQEIKEYISENRHLPEIPSAKEMEANGIDLGDMNMRLLKKIEELTLYQIELLERMEKLETENARIDELEKKLLELTSAEK